MTLPPTVLRALAEGVDRLNDGDPDDRRVAEQVEHFMLTEHGIVLERMTWVPKEQVTQGYVLGGTQPVVAFQNVEDQWTTGTQVLPPGTKVYLDADCTLFLRKTG